MIEVLDVRVGRPALLATTRRGEVMSAIAKQSVDEFAHETLRLDVLNLDGDDQADRSVHGGPDKSVYCYPFDHAAAWTAEGFDLPPGSVGENLVVGNVDESVARIGDVWRWGGALVQISQPRAPCFKLALRTGRRELAAAMVSSGRCGWYLRTLEVGRVPLRGPLELVDSDPASATVADAFASMFPNLRTEARDPATIERVLASPALAPEWAGYVRARNPLASPDQ